MKKDNTIPALTEKGSLLLKLMGSDIAGNHIEVFLASRIGDESAVKAMFYIELIMFDEIFLTVSNIEVLSMRRVTAWRNHFLLPSQILSDIVPFFLVLYILMNTIVHSSYTKQYIF